MSTKPFLPYYHVASPAALRQLPSLLPISSSIIHRKQYDYRPFLQRPAQYELLRDPHCPLTNFAGRINDKKDNALMIMNLSILSLR